MEDKGSRLKSRLKPLALYVLLPIMIPILAVGVLVIVAGLAHTVAGDLILARCISR